MNTTITSLENTFWKRRKFINMAWDIYQDYCNWVPPLKINMHTLLNPDKHPFHRHAEAQLFLAERNGKVVGRIAAHVNHAHNDYWNDQVGFFGFFECINNQEIANLLFGAAKEFLRSHHCTHIRGPFNWSVNDDCGLLIDSFDREPVIMMPYNPPYYRQLLENAGFEKIKDLYAYHIEGTQKIPERLQQSAETVKQRHNFILRTVNMKNFWKEVEIIKRIYNQAWGNNWGTVPTSEEEANYLAKQLKLIVDPNLCYIAEVDDQAVGFSVTLPDINQAIKYAQGRLFPLGLLKILWHKRHIDCVRVFLLGVLKEHRHRGIDVTMYYQTFKDALKRGYYAGEFSWILEDNYPMRNALEKLGAEIYKTYRIYQQPL